VLDEAIHLSLFPFSLAASAQTWLHSFQKNNLTTKAHELIEKISAGDHPNAQRVMQPKSHEDVNYMGNQGNCNHNKQG